MCLSTVRIDDLCATAPAEASRDSASICRYSICPGTLECSMTNLHSCMQLARSHQITSKYFIPALWYQTVRKLLIHNSMSILSLIYLVYKWLLFYLVYTSYIMSRLLFLSLNSLLCYESIKRNHYCYLPQKSWHNILIFMRILDIIEKIFPSICINFIYSAIEESSGVSAEENNVIAES